MGKKKKKTLSTYQSEPDPKLRKRRPGCEAEGEVVPGQGWACSRPLCQLPRQAVRLRLASRGQHIAPECRLRGAWRLAPPSPPPTGRPRLLSVLCASYSHASIHACLVASALHFPVGTHLPWKPPSVFRNQNLALPSPEQEGPFMPFWGRRKLPSTLGHHLGLFLMCCVCKIRWEGNFLHEANSFFLSSCTSRPGGAICSVHLDSHVSDAANV